jgi:hypothetical protein
MTLYSPTQHIAHSAAITHRVATIALMTDLDFALTRSAIQPQKRSAPIIGEHGERSIVGK